MTFSGQLRFFGMNQVNSNGEYNFVRQQNECSGTATGADGGTTGKTDTANPGS